VYTKLEQLLPLHKDHPALAPVYRVVAGLQRSAAMRADLAYLLGTGWEQQLERSAAAEAYAAHLQQLSDTSPHLLLPYAFSLYVPILLGFMGQRLRRSLALPPDGTKGLAFFQVSGCVLVIMWRGEGW
jgi:heme oxygenase